MKHYWKRLQHLDVKSVGRWVLTNRNKLACFIGGGSSLALILISCTTTNSSFKLPPLIPGAEYAGTESCETCHEKEVKGFKGTSHGMRFIEDGSDKGCESCHGPGSLHVESGGERATILRGNEAACYTCHQRVRGEFAQQFRHPVPEGRMGCSDCHDMHAPHDADTELVQKETCLKCHQEFRGPWTFEHEPVEHDGCSVCHNPHGSFNNRMLKERDYNLCLKCHYSTQYQGIGHYAHRRALNPINVDPTGRYATCLGCHRAVHGSNFSKELRTQ